MIKNLDYIEIEYIKKIYPKTYRFFTILPGFIAISLISIIMVNYWIFLLDNHVEFTGFIYLIAFLILFYYLWWIIRGFEYIIFIFMSAFRLFKNNKLNYNKILFESKNLNNEEKSMKSVLAKDMNPNDVIHWFILPTYKESLEIIRETMQNLFESEYDKSKFAITIAGEDRDKDNFLKVVNRIKQEFDGKFGYLDFTVHPKDIPGEVIGKGGNITYSAQNQYNKILETFKVSPDKIMVTTLDADTNIDKTYPAILTYEYVKSKNRKYKSYQPMIFFFNNFWDAPFFSKIVSLGNSFWILFNSLKKFGMRNFSTHAQPLDALIETNFWSRQTIVEDGHQYRRSYFAFDSRYECVPIFTKVYQDCNLNTSIIKTAKAQYNQLRRWAHGAEDVAYVFCQWLYNFKNISFGRTLYEFLRMLEGTILWSTLHIVLMFGLTFTIIKDIKLSPFISLGGTISFFIKISFLIFLFVLSLQLLFSPWNKLKSKFDAVYNVSILIILYLWAVGPTLFVFSGLSALHTQVALMLGKPMKKFNITEKIRK